MTIFANWRPSRKIRARESLYFHVGQTSEWLQKELGVVKLREDTTYEGFRRVTLGVPGRPLTGVTVSSGELHPHNDGELDLDVIPFVDGDYRRDPVMSFDWTTMGIRMPTTVMSEGLAELREILG